MVTEVPTDVSEQLPAESMKSKVKSPYDDDKCPIFGQLPFIKGQYSRPGVAPGQGQSFEAGRICGADTFGAFSDAVTHYSPATNVPYFFMLFYDIAVGRVKVELKVVDVDEETLRHSHGSLHTKSSVYSSPVDEAHWKCPQCSERNLPQAPSCLQCGRAYLYYSPESTPVNAILKQTVNCNTPERIISLSYLRLLIKSILFRNTSALQKPLILSDRACELTLLSVIVQKILRGDCSDEMPRPLFDDPSVQACLRKSFISFEHGTGLHFMRELLDSLKQTALSWLHKEEHASVTAPPPAPSKSEPLANPQVGQSKCKDDLVDSSFTLELHCENYCGGRITSSSQVTVKEMVAFQTRPMQHFTHDDQECDMIEKYLCEKQTPSLDGTETSLDIADLKRFKWAAGDSGSIWLKRLQEDLEHQRVSAGSGHAAFELKCYEATALETIDDSSSNIESYLRPLRALQSEMSGLYNDLIRLLVLNV